MNAPVQHMNLAAENEAHDLLEVSLVSVDQAGETSGECLLQIITDLKRFYQQRNFSHVERFGSPDPLSETVLRDLSNAYDSAVLWMNPAREGDSPPQLASPISLKLLAG